MNKTDLENLRKLASETKFYDIIKMDTPIDRIFANILRDVGKTVITGSNINFPFDVLVKGDRVFQVYFTKEYMKDYESIFIKYKKMEELPVNEIMEKVLIKKTHITVIQIDNKEQADKIREEILKEFQTPNRRPQSSKNGLEK
jgi:hypothetical protein